MDSLKETALKAILNDEFQEEELEALLDHVYLKNGKEYLEAWTKKRALGGAMRIIAQMDIVDGRINDTAYSQVMEELENMRQDWLSNQTDLERKENKDADDGKDDVAFHIETMPDEPLDSTNNKKDRTKKKSVNLSPEERKKILSGNAAKAREALAKKRKNQ